MITKISGKLLITGGSGFIGSHLIKALQKHSVKITSIQRHPSVNLPPNVTQTIGDISNAQTFKKLKKNSFDYAIHSAAAVNHRYPRKEEFFDTNVKGTRNFYHYAANQTNKRRWKKIVHISTVGVYGPIVSPPGDENTPQNPQSLYEKSKYKSEKIAKSFVSRLPINIVQPSLVYGPGDTRSGLSSLIKAVIKKRFLPLGNQPILMHPAYIDNLADGIILSLATSKSGFTWILADKNAYPLTDLVEKIATAVKIKSLPGYLPIPIAQLAGKIGDSLSKIGLKTPLTTSSVDFATHHRAYSIAAAQKDLGYQPKITFSQGVRSTISWYRKNHVI